MEICTLFAGKEGLKDPIKWWQLLDREQLFSAYLIMSECVSAQFLCIIEKETQTKLHIPPF